MEMQMGDRATPVTNQGPQAKEPSLSPRNGRIVLILCDKKERYYHKKQRRAWPKFSKKMDDYLELTKQITQEIFSNEEMKQL